MEKRTKKIKKQKGDFFTGKYFITSKNHRLGSNLTFSSQKTAIAKRLSLVLLQERKVNNENSGDSVLIHEG